MEDSLNLTEKTENEVELVMVEELVPQDHSLKTLYEY